MNSREVQAQADHERSNWVTGFAGDGCSDGNRSSSPHGMQVLDITAVHESLVFCVTWSGKSDGVRYLFAIDLGGTSVGDTQAASQGIWVQVLRIVEESDRFIKEAVPASRRTAWIVTPYLAQL